MPKHININTQTIFCLLPFLDIVAAFRIKKLRKYLLLFFLVGAIPNMILEPILFPELEFTDQTFLHLLTFYYGVDDLHFVYSVVYFTAITIFVTIVIRKWTNKWNSDF